ncbi:hypothetical protein RI367_006411 [Sorochytrium milnesiophthora]
MASDARPSGSSLPLQQQQQQQQGSAASAVSSHDLRSTDISPAVTAASTATDAGEEESAQGFKLSLGAMSFAAGTVGGFAGVLAGQPFDTIKVRLQVQGDGGRRVYRGIGDCFYKIVRDETVFGLFKGMSSPLLGVVAANALLFGVYGSILEAQLAWSAGTDDDDDTPNLASVTPTLTQIFIAGAGSGLVNSFISCPIELSKIRLQNQTDSKNSLVQLRPGTPHFSGPLHVLRHLYKSHGIRGPFTGMAATLLRETPSYGTYFFAYELMCRLMAPTPPPRHDPLVDGHLEDIEPPPVASASLSNLQLLMAGGLAGVAGWMSTYPADLIKTKIQSADRGTYSSTLACFAQTARAEGIRGLFRGTVATILRAFPTNAATFLAYHYSMEGLKEWSGCDT